MTTKLHSTLPYFGKIQAGYPISTTGGKNMMVYIAAPFADAAKMDAIAEKLEHDGHKVTHKWWKVEINHVPKDPKEALAFHQMHANLDFKGVVQADVMLLINSAKSEGKAVEQGIALSEGIPIVAVGKLGEHSKNVFHYLGDYVWVDDIDVALEVLKTMSYAPASLRGTEQ